MVDATCARTPWAGRTRHGQLNGSNRPTEIDYDDRHTKRNRHTL
jgi:hypothetical protein